MNFKLKIMNDIYNKKNFQGIEALYQRCKLLEADGRWDEYIQAGTLLQYSHAYFLETDEEFNGEFKRKA